MRIFNADGSEAMMCGNASRCIGKYVYEKGLTDKEVITLETLSGIKILKLHTGNGVVKDVTVDMGTPLLSNPGQIAMKTGGIDVYKRQVRISSHLALVVFQSGLSVR